MGIIMVYKPTYITGGAILTPKFYQICQRVKTFLAVTDDPT